jgi:serine protease Do
LKLNAASTVSVSDSNFGDENQILVGSSVGYMGFPFAQSGLHTLKVSSSVISAKLISQTGTNQFQLDAMVHEGNSGGPLIDLASGKIIGIISGRFSPTGNGGSIRIGGHALGTESTISYATTIKYGKQLMQSEGLNG